MFETWQRWGIASLVLGSSAINGLAAESTIFSFNGGNVAITPHQTVAATTSLAATNERIRPHRSSTLNAANVEKRLLQTRPISLKLDEHGLPPSPRSEDFDTSQKISGVGATSIVPTSLQAPMHHEIMMVDDCELPVISPRITEVIPRPTTSVTQAALYREVYSSIPFIRSEYNASPSYRHDATMEFLFNQLRPTVIKRSTSNSYNYYDVNYGYGGPMFSPYSAYSPYGIRIIQGP